MSTTSSAPATVVERDQPLEKSILWRWMKDFYAEGGMSVWSDGDVPFYITNTPTMASDWAAVIFALTRDLHTRGALKPDHPIPVMEIGPGTGRFAFYLLQELEKLESRSRCLRPDGYRYTLILCELGHSGLRSLSEHPNLQPYLDDGKLHLRLLDAGADAWPRPWPAAGQSRETLLPSPNPLVIIGNYLLDSLPHDVVRIQDGQARRGLATVGVHGLKSEEDPRRAAGLGDRIDLKFSYPDRDEPYENPAWNEILSYYTAHCEDTHIPFPTTSLRLLERARHWSETAVAMLVADKSFTTVDQLEGLEEPEIVGHGGGFSFNANIHSLGLYAEGAGGFSHSTTCRDGTLDLSLVFLPSPEVDLPLPFLECDWLMKDLEQFHSVDRFRVREEVEDKVPDAGLRLCLDLVRLSGFDPQVLYELSDMMLAEMDVDDLEEETEGELIRILDEVLLRVFPVGDDVDVAFEVGRLAYRLEVYTTALEAFSTSLEQYGDDPKAYFNIGLCRYYRREWSAAESAFTKALTLDDDYDDAQEWIEKTRRAAKRQAAPQT